MAPRVCSPAALHERGAALVSGLRRENLLHGVSLGALRPPDGKRPSPRAPRLSLSPPRSRWRRRRQEVQAPCRRALAVHGTRGRRSHKWVHIIETPGARNERIHQRIPVLVFFASFTRALYLKPKKWCHVSCARELFTDISRAALPVLAGSGLLLLSLFLFVVVGALFELFCLGLLQPEAQGAVARSFLRKRRRRQRREPFTCRTTRAKPGARGASADDFHDPVGCVFPQHQQ